MKQQILERLDVNLSRANTLVDVYETYLAGPGPGRRDHQKTDVLRAAVVFTHASIEEVLRSIAYEKLPHAGVDYLDDLPLPGGKKKSFGLGALSAHRGKTIDELITESVNERLEKSNYNNTDEIVTLCNHVGADPAAVRQHFPQINEVMKRRHKIVHRADRSNLGGRGNHSVAHIGPKQVKAWIIAAKDFCHDFVNSVPD